jgi:hypothetical protein
MQISYDVDKVGVSLLWSQSSHYRWG